MTLRLLDTDLPEHYLNSLDGQTLNETRDILRGIKRFGFQAIIVHASRVGDIDTHDAKFCYPRELLHQAFQEISADERKKLVSIVKAVYQYYKSSYPVHNTTSLRSVGCFISKQLQKHTKTVILNVLTAKIAGAQKVIVSSRRPEKILLAAAYVAGADYFLLFGGVQAIGALSYGFKSSALELPPCDLILGVGNHWEEAAKKIVSQEDPITKVDLIGGPNQILAIIGSNQGSEMRSIVARIVAETNFKERIRLYILTEFDEILLSFKLTVEEYIIKLEDSTKQSILTHIVNSSFGVNCKSYEKLIENALKFCPERLFIFSEATYEHKIRKSFLENNYLGGYMNSFKKD